MFSITCAMAVFSVLSGFGVSIREEDIFGLSDEKLHEPGEQECEEFLQDMIGSVTFTDHMAPILEGHWHVEAPVGGTFVGSTSSQQLTLIPNREPSTTWDLKRIIIPNDWLNEVAVMPTFSLQNVKTKEYLVVGTGSEMDGLALQGIVDAVSIKFTAKGLNIFINGVQSNYTLLPSEELGSNDQKEQERQLNYVPELPVFVGGSKDFTWERAQNFLGVKASNVAHVYGLQRQMFVETGKIRENRNHVVVASALKYGVCEMNPEALRSFSDEFTVMTEVRSLALKNHGCSHSMGLAQFSTLFQKVIEEECFTSCLSVMQSVLVQEKVDCKTSLDVDKIADKITSNRVCTELPSYSLDRLLEYAFSKKCLKWTPSRFLWNFGPREAPKQATYSPVCTIHPMDAPFVKSEDSIYQRGMCPEGTRCACPDDYTWTDHKMASEIRQGNYRSSLTIKGSLAFRNLINGAKTFILAPLTYAGAWDVAWNLAVKQQFPKLSMFSDSVTGVLTSGFWNALFFWRINAMIKSSSSFRCAKTVGCWPILPSRTKVKNIRGACRIPKNENNGGSPAWFMPPPMLKFTKQSFFYRTCVLKKCSESEVKEEKVGFFGKYGRDMLNCQPLAWSDMNATQQGWYKISLMTNGVMEEYELNQEMDIFHTRRWRL